MGILLIKQYSEFREINIKLFDMLLYIHIYKEREKERKKERCEIKLFLMLQHIIILQRFKLLYRSYIIKMYLIFYEFLQKISCNTVMKRID